MILLLIKNYTVAHFDNVAVFHKYMNILKYLLLGSVTPFQNIVGVLKRNKLIVTRNDRS